MKKISLTLAALTITALCSTLTCKAATVADWDFESRAITTTTASDFTYGVADSGLQTSGSSETGHHALTNTVWSQAAGSSSTNALQANRWSSGDYWQFQLNLTGYQNPMIAFDTRSSNTGPANFKVQWSTDGTTFTDLASGTYTNTATFANHAFDFSAVNQLDGASTAYFRLVDTSTTNVTGGTVGTAGTSAIDNFVVNATPVPEPATVVGGILALAGLGWHQRRRLVRLVRA